MCDYNDTTALYPVIYTDTDSIPESFVDMAERLNMVDNTGQPFGSAEELYRVYCEATDDNGRVRIALNEAEEMIKTQDEHILQMEMKMEVLEQENEWGKTATLKWNEALAEIEELKEANECLLNQRRELGIENDEDLCCYEQLQKENKELKKDYDFMDKENDRLLEKSNMNNEKAYRYGIENDRLKEKIEKLTNDIVELEKLLPPLHRRSRQMPTLAECRADPNMMSSKEALQKRTPPRPKVVDINGMEVDNAYEKAKHFAKKFGLTEAEILEAMKTSDCDYSNS